jgi:hypothetical protein
MQEGVLDIKFIVGFGEVLEFEVFSDCVFWEFCFVFWDLV